jgi:hypothetical protein
MQADHRISETTSFGKKIFYKKNPTPSSLPLSTPQHKNHSFHLRPTTRIRFLSFLSCIIMGFWKRKPETPEEKLARRERRAARELENYNSIMAAFVQPLPSFSQWTAPIPRGHPPAYETTGQNAYMPATYYPNQSYENPYGQQTYQYSACSQGSVSSRETLPSYGDSSMYNPWSRQVRFLFSFCYKNSTDMGKG